MDGMADVITVRHALQGDSSRAPWLKNRRQGGGGHFVLLIGPRAERYDSKREALRGVIICERRFEPQNCACGMHVAWHRTIYTLCGVRCAACGVGRGVNRDDH